MGRRRNFSKNDADYVLQRTAFHSIIVQGLSHQERQHFWKPILQAWQQAVEETSYDLTRRLSRPQQAVMKPVLQKLFRECAFEVFAFIEDPNLSRNRKRKLDFKLNKLNLPLFCFRLLGPEENPIVTLPVGFGVLGGGAQETGRSVAKLELCFDRTAQEAASDKRIQKRIEARRKANQKKLRERGQSAWRLVVREEEGSFAERPLSTPWPSYNRINKAEKSSDVSKPLYLIDIQAQIEEAEKKRRDFRREESKAWRWMTTPIDPAVWEELAVLKDQLSYKPEESVRPNGEQEPVLCVNNVPPKTEEREREPDDEALSDFDRPEVIKETLFEEIPFRTIDVIKGSLISLPQQEDGTFFIPSRRGRTLSLPATIEDIQKVVGKNRLWRHQTSKYSKKRRPREETRKINRNNLDLWNYE